MNLSKSALVMTILGTFSFFLTLAHAASSPAAQMRQLSVKSQKSTASCDRFSHEARALLGDEDREKPWTWDSKTEKLFKLAESYPGTPKSTQEAYLLFQKTPNAASLFKREDVLELRQCAVMDFFDVSKKLIASLSHLPKERQTQAIQIIENHLRSELENSGPLMPVLVEGSVIEKLANSGAVPGLTTQKEKISAAIKNMVFARKQMNDELAKLSSDEMEKSYLKTWVKETSLAKKSADELLSILKSS